MTEGDLSAQARSPAGSFSTLRRARRRALIWGAILVALTSWPSPPSVPAVSWIPSFDKIVHCFLYGVEGFLLYSAVVWPGRRRGFSLSRVVVIGGFLAVFGTADETHQAFIPGRSMEALDAAGDTAGAILGALAAAGRAGRRSGSGGMPPARGRAAGPLPTS